jgi:hypothetical protein
MSDQVMKQVDEGNDYFIFNYTVISYFKVLSQNFSGGAKRNEKSQSG